MRCTRSEHVEIGVEEVVSSECAGDSTLNEYLCFWIVSDFGKPATWQVWFGRGSPYPRGL